MKQKLSKWMIVLLGVVGFSACGDGIPLANQYCALFENGGNTEATDLRKKQENMSCEESTGIDADWVIVDINEVSTPAVEL